MRFKSNKAVYMAALVADEWAGAENLEKQLCDGPTDRRTNRRINQRTDQRTDQKVTKRIVIQTRLDTRLPQSRAGGQGP